MLHKQKRWNILSFNLLSLIQVNNGLIENTDSPHNATEKALH